jgi:glucosamine-6-phosphate isomerase
MKQIIYKDYKELSVKTAEMIADVIIKKPDALLCFPAGETSVGTFAQLIKLNREGSISFKSSRIVGLDEWAGLGKMKTENCFSFLKRHFFDHIDYDPGKMCFFDGESADLQSECVKTDRFIKENGPVDMMLLGMGMNGHLGLNEPGTSFNLYSHIVELDDTTKKVGKKYFSGEVNLTRGVSLGIKYIMEASLVILQLNGNRKAEIVRKLIESEFTEALPASALKRHSNAYLLLDREAAAYI